MDHLLYTDFEALYKRYYKRAFLFTKSYIHDELAAEDISSESLIKLWESIRRGQVKSPEAFLLTILRNKALDHLRHEAIREETFLKLKTTYQEELEFRISMLEACDPAEIFTEEIHRIVQDTLNQFPQQTRLIFELSRFSNKENKEIAREMGITVKTVEYHITKILKALRISLKDYLPFFYFFFLFK